MGQRRRAREAALQILYGMEIADSSPDDAICSYYEGMTGSDEKEASGLLLVRPFTERLVRGVYLHRSEIDQALVAASEHWKLERMSVVDRNILRLALFEMLHCPDVPPKVSINEAIDIGKKFGSEDSGAFINGMLDHILGELKKATASTQVATSSPD